MYTRVAERFDERKVETRKKKKKNEEGEAMGGGEEASERTEEVLRVAGTSEKETSLPLSILGVARVF